jgi:hypothetical protein
MAIDKDFRIKNGIEFESDGSFDIGNSSTNRPGRIYAATDILIGSNSVLDAGDLGSTVQAYDADLAAIAALAKTDGNIIVGNGSTWVAESGATARASLGLAIGSQVQAYDAGLAAIAGLAVTDGNFIVGNGSTWVVESGATVRTSLGLGTLATLSSVNAATITDNSVGAAELNVSGNGTAGQALVSDGDGTMSWSTISFTDTDVSVANLQTRLGQISTATNIGTGASADFTFSADVIVTGDLTVNGTTTTLNTTNTVIDDNLIVLNDGIGAGANGNDSGLLIERGSTGNNVFIGWDESSDRVTVATTTDTGTSTGSLTLTQANFEAASIFSSALTATGTVQFGSLSDGAITITAFVDEDNMASNSATLVPTQQSVKAYVDAEVTAATGGGIFGSGSPSANQVAVFASGSTIAGDADFTWNGTILEATELVARAVSGSTTTGALATSDANKKTTLTGNITVNSGYAVDDVIILDPNGTARTVTVGTGVTLYVNGEAKTATNTFTTPANGLVSIAWRSSTVGIVTGIETAPEVAPQTATLTTTTATTIWSVAHADYDVVKLTVKAKTSSGIQASEILVTHNGTTAIGTEYAKIFTGSSLATFDVSISGSDLILEATGASTASTEYVVQASPVLA